MFRVRVADKVFHRLGAGMIAALFVVSAAQAASDITQTKRLSPEPAPTQGGGAPATQQAPQGQPMAVYVAQNGQQTGPFDRAALTAMVQNGTLSVASIVWQQGMTDWGPAGNVPGLQSLFAVAAPSPQQTPPAVPPTVAQPAFDVIAYLTGTWDSEPQTIAIEGVGQGTSVFSTTYKSNGSVTVFGTIDAPTTYGTIRQTLSGQGTYKVTLLTDKTFQITPNITINYYMDGQPPESKILTTPFINRVLDQNTVEDENGDRYRRQ